MPPSGDSAPRAATCGRGASDVSSLAERYDAVRAFTQRLCAPLEIEDQVIQSMPAVSPTRWHLGHTTWFFETFVLLRARPQQRVFNYDFPYLFNSYYNTVGRPYPQPQRGLLSRPTVAEVRAYRDHVDELMREVIAQLHAARPADRELITIIETGLHHEQQHQELILTDIKHVFSCNPLSPAYRADLPRSQEIAVPRVRWHDLPTGVHEIGHDGATFCYDNETPRHPVQLHGGALANRLVTCGEYLEFIADGGYRRWELWLSEGWEQVQAEQWKAPLYWEQQNDGWWLFTLGGLRPVNPAEPLCHVSFYEADAYARWAGARLPTEAEWEVTAARATVDGNFVEHGHLHPTPLDTTNETTLAQLFGDVWEWTASPYVAYPGFAPPAGALGEYNAKFMCNQHVLRGGSCCTPRTHLRPTYRNFWHAGTRWQMTGIRLAR